MTIKIAVDAGHGINTAGKRTPDNEREWTFNNKVLLAFVEHVTKYENVQVLRIDDPTGKTDVPLNDRTKKANSWGADIYISFHHNANTGKWGTWTGVETYVYSTSNTKSMELAKAIHGKYVQAMGLKDRGIKTGNFAVIRDTKMPSILLEGGYMDSTIDIKKMRDNSVLTKAGQAVADGVVELFKLKLKKDIKGVDLIVSEQTLNAAQEAVKNKAVKLGITDGKNAFREANQYYVWNALIPAYEKIQELQKEINDLKARLK